LGGHRLNRISLLNIELAKFGLPHFSAISQVNSYKRFSGLTVISDRKGKIMTRKEMDKALRKSKKEFEKRLKKLETHSLKISVPILRIGF
jgi:hypothetical protein